MRNLAKLAPMQNQTQRIEAIDYLRGLMALSIMLFHLFAWSSYHFDGGTALGRIGIYGVSTFYIVSGMSLYLAYKKLDWHIDSTVTFWKKRILRIAPLYILACTLVLLSNYLASGSINASTSKILSNITLVFGVTNPGNYLPAGGWSIGNEVFFYILFPLIMLSLRSAYAFFLIFSYLAYAYIDFAFFKITPSLPLAAQWGLYIQPMNQAFLFLIGICIAIVSQRIPTPNRAICCSVLAASVFLFCAIPVSGDAINIVTGENRLYFTLICSAAAFACFNIGLYGKHLFEVPLKFLGNISFSVYLLHGVVFSMMQRHLYTPFLASDGYSLLLFAITAVMPTVIALSWLCYTYFELPFMRLGRARKAQAPSSTIEQAV